MRQAFLIGTATLLVGVGAISANALPINKDASPYFQANPQHAGPPYGPSAAWPMQEGRAVDSGAGYWGAPAGDDAYRRPTDNGYHDPRFSLQQDEIYDGRF